MNSYFLGLSGSWVLLIALVIASYGLSAYVYRRTIPPIDNSRRLWLMLLRGSALALLLFVMFEPIFTMIKSSTEDPKLVLLADNSKSMAMADAGGIRKDKYLQAVEAANPNSLGNNLKPYLFDESTKSLSAFALDSLKFNGQSTDISRAIRAAGALDESENIRAALLVTDGAFNLGNNPLFDAENFGRPIYVIGIGDTNEPKDVSLVSLLTNEVAYIDNPVPINVNFKSTGFNGQRVKITLTDNGAKISEQEVQLNSDQESASAIFQYMPKTEGIRKLQATISPLQGEITDKNNSAGEFLRVLKNKRSIALFAGNPSPDYSFIKQNISREKGVEIKEFIQKQGAEFYKAPTQQDINQSEVIVMIGFPVASTPNNVLQMIAAELAHGKPLLFVAGLTTDYNKLKIIQDALPFVTVSSRAQEFLAVPDINKQALSNPLLRVTGTDDDITLWNNLPPLFRTETFVRVKPESEVVSTMKINNVALKDPLILTRNVQNQKTVAIMGYGLYRWKLLGYASELSKGRTETPDLFSQLLANGFRWLSVNEQNKLVNVRTSKPRYNQGEKIEFIGEVYDASYTPIDNANVAVKLSGGNDSRDIILNSMGNGRYYGTVDGLGQGDYMFTANATASSRNIGSDNGRFSIGELALEYRNLRMNIELLKSIAERSGGKFYLYKDAGQFLNDLKNNRSFEPKGITKRLEIAFRNYPYLLGLAILFFAIEWFIRKRSGMI